MTAIESRCSAVSLLFTRDGARQCAFAIAVAGAFFAGVALC